MTETAKKMLWAVYTNTDLTEGRGSQYVKYFCQYEATAIRLAKRGYVQGSDCPVKQIEVLDLNGTLVLPMSVLKIEQPNQEDEGLEKRIIARKQAVERAKTAGLSDEDIALLRATP